MIKCDNEMVSVEGTAITLMAEVMMILKAFKGGVIDKMPQLSGVVTTEIVKKMINEVLDGKEPWNEAKDASKTYEAMEALNSLLDRMEKTH